jgi:hypothetical protein
MGARRPIRSKSVRSKPIGGVERSVENLQSSYVLPTSLNRNAGIPRFPQMEERSKPPAIIGECRFVNIFTLSTTTKFFL